MQLIQMEIAGHTVAVIGEKEPVLTDAQSALDLIASVRYAAGEVDAIILSKEAVAEIFFDLRTGVAGEILQKMTNYWMKIAIVGDFSGYESKSLRDFIYESNKGRSVFFAATQREAEQSLRGAFEKEG